MRIESDKDFPALRKQFGVWRKRFPMFTHDVNHIEDIIETHIQNFAIAGVHYRQTKQRRYLETAKEEIDKINNLLGVIEKIELMAMLSRS